MNVSESNNINPNLRYAPRALPDVEKALTAIRAGDSSVLSRAITLLESETTAHRNWSRDLVNRLMDTPVERSFRLGISGSPGVGKSTFIEAFGLELIKQDFKVAVLAVDPSSAISGGSILGDKTRMEELSRHPRAFVRPSPSSGFLGGVARVTRESIFLCEAAGYDYLLVETVGVGQSEMAVHGMTDAFLLLAQPGAGDELQGIKRGILEMADLIVVNKADLLPEAVRQTRAELERSLHLAPPRESGWVPPVQSIAALPGQGIYEVYQTLAAYRSLLDKQQLLLPRRERQYDQWLRDSVESELLRALHHDPETLRYWQKAYERLRAGEIQVPLLAEELIRHFHETQNHKPH